MADEEPAFAVLMRCPERKGETPVGLWASRASFETMKIEDESSARCLLCGQSHPIFKTETETNVYLSEGAPSV